MITCKFSGELGNNLFTLAALINIALENKYNSCITHSYKAQSIVRNFKELASGSYAEPSRSIHQRESSPQPHLP